MPEIKQYFAPIRRIAPSSAGEEAAQRLAGAGERTAEAWVQAARRFGSLGTETADMLKQQGTLQRQDIESFRGLSHVEADRVNNPTIRVRGRADSLLSPDRGTAAYDQGVQRANAAGDVALGAARLFSAHIGRGTSTDYVDGTPVRPTRQTVTREATGRNIPTADDPSSDDQSFTGGSDLSSYDKYGGQFTQNNSGGYDPSSGSFGDTGETPTPDASHAPDLIGEIGSFIGGVASSWWDGLKDVAAAGQQGWPNPPSVSLGTDQAGKNIPLPDETDVSLSAEEAPTL